MLIALLLLTEPSFAEEPVKDEPTTALEEFLATSGTVIVKSYRDIGVTDGAYGGKVEVSAVRMTNPTTGETQRGVLVSVTDSTGRQRIAYVDYDEIDGLLAGLEYIAGVDETAVSFENYEAIYATNGGLKVIQFNNKGDPWVSIKCGSVVEATMFMKGKYLANVEEDIRQAKAALDE